MCGCYEGKPATSATIEANGKVYMTLPFSDRQDFEDAQRGRLGDPSPPLIRNSEGRVVWDMPSYLAFEQDAMAPDSINPSLYRQAKLNDICGLFQVTDGIYQVRGYDLSNMTIVESDNGIIIIDPLISCECAEAALELYQEYRVQQGWERQTVMGVIYTHSHIDHFGGVEGVISAAEATARGTPILAPDGFLEEAVSENVYAGPAMGRRAQYMYGAPLPKGPRLQVDAGLGKTQSTGRISLLPPTLNICAQDDGQPTVHVVDGLEIHFQLTPNTEAPAEMNFYFPRYHALCMAENATHNLHNLLTLRGAKVRDALSWSKYLDQAIELFGREAQVLFAQHHWPRWRDTPERLVDYLAKQRDLYRYLNDQTLRMINKGYTGIQIAEQFQLPESLTSEWYCRGYYGSVSHDVKAVYQRYIGWFDGNPADLWELPPEQSAPLYVSYMGGADEVLRRAQEAFDSGEYRWVAQVTKHVVYAEPENSAAKELQADALEQLGYQAETSTWRNFFLMGAYELRSGIQSSVSANAGLSLVQAMTLEQLFDGWGVRLDGPLAGKGGRIALNWIVAERDASTSRARLLVENGAISYVLNKLELTADATLLLAREVLEQLWVGQLSPMAAVEQGLVQIAGSEGQYAAFFALVNGPASQPNPQFPIVTPLPPITW